MSDRAFSEQLASEKTKFAWARLNADTLFLALLIAAAGIFAIVYSSEDATVRGLGHTSPSFYLRAGSYVLAGALIAMSLFTEHIAVEVLGRAVFLAGVFLELVREVALFGWGNSNANGAIALFLIVLLTTLLRLSVLLSKKGLVVHLPERESPGDST